MAAVTVTFDPGTQTAEAQPGETLMEAANRAGIQVQNLCGGQGVCGKCRVKIMKGDVDFSSRHLSFFSKNELDAGFVLACQTKVKETDVEVWIPPEARYEEAQVLTDVNIFEYEEPAEIEDGPEIEQVPLYRPLCRKYFLEMPHPSLDDNVSDLERIYRALQKKLPDTRLQARFSCLPDLAETLRKNDWQVTATLYKKDLDSAFLLGIEPGNTAHRNYGVAVDIGTTTIAAQLINLQEGVTVGVEGCQNLQARYGEDVISRMVFACGRGGGVGPLQDAVISTINSLVDSLCKGAGIEHEDITAYTAAGNTTMTHLMLGLEPCHIRLEPYIPTATRFPPVRAHDLHLLGHSQAVLHCAPCVSSYVGGDITAGVLATGISDQSKVRALIDVGTNGEIVIGNNEWLVCCAASAGPAFEGGGVKCGMRATRGAVQTVKVRNGEVKYTTIGKTKARGLCGSALIDLMAELSMEGIIDQSGKFTDYDLPNVQVVEDVPEFVVVPAEKTETGENPVVITEDDIGNLIKSKGAIMAAMKILVESIGLTFTDLDRIYVAGGFGRYLDVDKSIMIGLLPDVPRDRVQFVGNSSLAGARASLLSSHAFQKAESVGKQMTYLELSVYPNYMDEFVAALFLPHTQTDLFPSVVEEMERRKGTAA